MMGREEDEAGGMGRDRGREGRQRAVEAILKCLGHAGEGLGGGRGEGSTLLEMGEMGRALNLLTKLGGGGCLSAEQVDRLVHFVVLDVLLKVSGRGGEGRREGRGEKGGEGRGRKDGAWHLGLSLGLLLLYPRSSICQAQG